MFALRLIAPVAAMVLLASAAFAETRAALVIGNSAYASVTALDNPVNDASDLATALEGLGFDVHLGTDLSRNEMLALAETFGETAETSDVALLFYAGHGFQIQGRNYLVPVDAEIRSFADLSAQTVAMDELVGQMKNPDSVRLVILDACRDNPFDASGIDLGDNGLARIGTDANFMFVYATQPDNVAYDGTGRNSFFTEALLNHIYTPGQDISDLMISVRKDVLAATGGRQIPWDNSSLTRQFQFDTSPQTVSEDTLLWQVAAKAQESALMQLYLDRYPEGAHAEEVLAFLDTADQQGTATRSLTPSEAEAEAERIWTLAQRSRLRPLLEYYLERFPQGRHADQAERLMETIPDPKASTPAAICTRLATHPRDRTANTPGVPFSHLQENALAAIQACSAAVAQSPDLTHFTALLARATIAAGDVDRAVDLYKRAAESGDLRAMVSLAQLYENGIGVRQDPERALALYEEAAEGGSLDAMINLAVTLFEDTGTTTDRDRAIELLQRAAAGGSAKATFNLGVLAQDGVVGEPSEALALFDRAARGGEYQGYLAAAILLDEGRGVPEDPARAARMLLIGAAEDDGTIIEQLTQNLGDWSTDTLKAIQRYLQKAGHYSGAVDGIPGPRFRLALQNWRVGGFDLALLNED